MRSDDLPYMDILELVWCCGLAVCRVEVEHSIVMVMCEAGVFTRKPINFSPELHGQTEHYYNLYS